MTLYDRKAARRPPVLNYIPEAPLKPRDTFAIALRKLGERKRFPALDRRATQIMQSAAVQQLRDNLDSTASFLKRPAESQQFVTT